MLLTKDQVLTKLTKAQNKMKAQRRKDLAQYKKDLAKLPKRQRKDSYLNRYIASAALDISLPGFQLINKSIMRFKVRTAEFAAPNRDFDYENGTSTSYRWYNLGQVIEAQYVVNSYSYSQQTNGHKHELINTLKALGIKFIQIEAPQGLQNLEGAADYALDHQATNLVASQYCLAKNKSSYLKRAKYWAKELARVEALGGKASKDLLNALREAGEERLAKIERSKTRAYHNAKYALDRARTQEDVHSIILLTAQVEKLRVKAGIEETKQAA